MTVSVRTDAFDFSTRFSNLASWRSPPCGPPQSRMAHDPRLSYLFNRFDRVDGSRKTGWTGRSRMSFTHEILDGSWFVPVQHNAVMNAIAREAPHDCVQ